VSGEALVKFADLFAEVFLLEFEECLGVFLFHARDEESEESLDEVFEASEHGRS